MRAANSSDSLDKDAAEARSSAVSGDSPPIGWEGDDVCVVDEAVEGSCSVGC